MHSRCWLRLGLGPIQSSSPRTAFGYGQLRRGCVGQSNWHHGGSRSLHLSSQKISSSSIVWTRSASTTSTSTSTSTAAEMHRPSIPTTATTTTSIATSNDRHIRPSPLSRLSTISLLRSLFLGYCFTSPRLLRVLMGAMNVIVQSKSPLLSPDRNPILRGVIRALVYDHFCAGATVSEVKTSIAEIKAAGYAGVILGYGREIVVNAKSGPSQEADSPIKSEPQSQHDQHIAQWVEGNRATLAMIGENDYMNIKFTGAGPNVSKCLASGAEPPEQLRQALDALCTQAAVQKSRIWIDAEQQIFQPTIDAWTLDLMRKHNRNHDALVWTTIQTYLKSSRATVGHFLQCASDEGWTLGIKQVRGAYIASDVRDRIWDTKDQTDESYNSIARDLLKKETGADVFPGFTASKFPELRLFLAGHNKESVRLATSLVTELVEAGRQVPPVQYGQLQGMADDISCDLVQQYEDIAQDARQHQGEEMYELKLRQAPLAYKCLCWGSVTEVLNFLMRRAVENASAADRLKDGLVELRNEVKRRMLLKTT